MMRKRLARVLSEMAEAVAPTRAHFVRVGRRSFSEACKIIHAARSDGPTWGDELLARVREFLLEEQGQDISLYAVDTRNRFDATHALGVLAGTIDASEFQPRKRDEYRRKLDEGAPLAGDGKGKNQHQKDVLGSTKVVSFIFPRELLGGCMLARSPSANANFAPADDLHHDARPNDVNDLARRLLDGIREGEVLCTFLRAESFRIQAAIALSACIRRFGALGSVPPQSWRDGVSLPASEQLERLKTIAGEYGFQARLEYNT